MVATDDAQKSRPINGSASGRACKFGVIAVIRLVDLRQWHLAKKSAQFRMSPFRGAHTNVVLMVQVASDATRLCHKLCQTTIRVGRFVAQLQKPQKHRTVTVADQMLQRLHFANDGDGRAVDGFANNADRRVNEARELGMPVRLDTRLDLAVVVVINAGEYRQ